MSLPSPVTRTMIVVGSLVTLALAPAAAGQPETPDALESLDRFIEDGVALWESPGFAVAVVKDGEVVFAKGYGVRTLGSSDRVDEHTLFAIGSTTKAMTAAAIGILVDEGKLAWDDAVTKHLPSFQLHDPFVTREITVRDLLTHRAGLPNADYLWYGRDNALDDILFRMRHVPPETSLRSSFTYQNVMYAAAGAVVEAASGRSWAEFIQRRIFDPLEMNRSLPTAADLDRASNVASPQYRVEGRIRVIDNASVDAVAAAGSVWSSVSDMAKWTRFLLESEGMSGQKLLKKETLEELFQPQTIVDRDEFYPTQALTRPKWTTYGLGWFQHDYASGAVDFHTGSIDGMVAIHGLLRDRRLGVLVLGNLDHAELRHAVMYRVFDLFGGLDRRDWSRELFDLYEERRRDAEARASAASRDRVEGTSPSLPLERYAGTYQDPLYGAARVVHSNGALRLELGPGLRGDLRHWHYDQFEVEWDAAWRGTASVAFAIDRKGAVGSLSVMGAELRRVEPKP